MSSSSYSSSDPSEEDSYESTSDNNSEKQKSENESSETESKPETQPESKPNTIEKKSENNDESDSNNSDNTSTSKEESVSTSYSEKKNMKAEEKSANPIQTKETHSDESEEESRNHAQSKSSNDSESEESKQSTENGSSTTKTSSEVVKKSTEKQESSYKPNKKSETISKQEESSDSSDTEVSEKSSSEIKSKSDKKKSTSKKSTEVLNDDEDDDDDQKKGKDSQKKSESSEGTPPPFDFTVVSKLTPQNQKTDRFGWAIDDENQGKPKSSKKERKLERVDSRKEGERESKWIDMMKKENWYKYYKKDGKYRKVLERRVKKGIPDCLRARAWYLILDPHAIDKPTREPIDTYYDKGVPSCDYVIRVDIPRTMPRVPMFNRKDVRISLYRVLRAYSNADPELGYYQGMAFSAAILLSYMDETTAFWSFVGLMKGKDHKLREFYDNQFTRLKEINKVWDYILLKKFKDVHDNLMKKNIDHLLYTTSWFLCAFMNLNFETTLRLRIFDRFALFGTRALISFGLTIIDMNRADLATGAFDVIIPILQNPHLTPAMKNWRDIIKVYDKDFISNKDFKQYFKKVGVKII